VHFWCIIHCKCGTINGKISSSLPAEFWSRKIGGCRRGTSAAALFSVESLLFLKRPWLHSSSFFRLLNAISLKCQMPKLHCAFCFLGSSRGVDLGRDHIESWLPGVVRGWEGRAQLGSREWQLLPGDHLQSCEPVPFSTQFIVRGSTGRSKVRVAGVRVRFPTGSDFYSVFYHSLYHSE